MGLIHCSTDSDRERDDALKTLLRTVKDHPELDLLAAPEWFMVKDTGMYTPSEFHLIRKLVQRSTLSNKTLVIPGSIAWRDNKGRYHNTALAIGGGRTVRAYTKQQDGGDTWFARNRNLTWKAGKGSGTFTWGQKRLGVEICLDHSYATLQEEAKKSGKPLDLQVVVSCGMSIHPSCLAPLTPKGHAMITDGSSPQTEVKSMTPQGTLQDRPFIERIPLEKTDKKGKVTGHDMYLMKYQLEVN